MLYLNCLINDSSDCLHITSYLVVMLQASFHTLESKKISKGPYMKSQCIPKTSILLDISPEDFSEMG